MNTIVIEKKEYVVLAKKEYEQLLTQAAGKTAPLRKRSLVEERNKSIMQHKR